jgi:hypothetical protein
MESSHILVIGRLLFLAGFVIHFGAALGARKSERTFHIAVMLLTMLGFGITLLLDTGS